MLTKGQLQNATRCKQACLWEDDCTCTMGPIGYGVKDCVRELAKTALAYRNMLNEALDAMDDVVKAIGEENKKEIHETGLNMSKVCSKIQDMYMSEWPKEVGEE